MRTERYGFNDGFRAVASRAVTDILRVNIEPPEHLSAFGPVVDGIVIPKEPSLLMEDHGASFYKNYEMLVGVARVEVSQ